MTVKCAWAGCLATADRPAPAGWVWLAEWGPGIPDGFYCPDHAAAIEAVREQGGLDDPTPV